MWTASATSRSSGDNTSKTLPATTMSTARVTNWNQRSWGVGPVTCGGKKRLSSGGVVALAAALMTVCDPLGVESPLSAAERSGSFISTKSGFLYSRLFHARNAES